MKQLLTAVVALGLAALITIPKLYRMAQIKAWIPGATITREVVAQKWHQLPSEYPRERDVYWISWGPAPIREVGPHRTNLEADDWARVEVGQPVNVVRIPGDEHTYTQNDIFVSTGNFVFDIVLLLIELTVGVAAIVRWRRARLAG